jgi:hypothetical protein
MAWIGGGSPVKRRLPGRTRRLERLERLTGEPHPLCRPVDRTEKSAMRALVATFVVAWLLVGLLAGEAAAAAGIRQEHAERGWRQVPATLLQSAAEGTGSSPDWGAAWVPARWQSPDGQRRTGLVATGLSARAGQQVPVWVTAAGQLTRPPLTAAGVYDQVCFVVLSVTMGLAVLLAVAAVSVRLLCDRRRMAGWQRAWDAVGPLWSRR